VRNVETGARVSVHQIVFHFKNLLWESIILLLSPPIPLSLPSTCKAYPIEKG